MPAHKLTKQPDDGVNLICTACQVKKPYSEFYAAKIGTWHYKTYSGYVMSCKECKRASSLRRARTDEARAKRNQRRAGNPEQRAREAAARQARYYANRDSRLLEKRKRYAGAEPEKKEAILAKNRERKLDPEKKARDAALVKAWRATPEGKAAHQASQRARKAAKRGGTGKLTKEDRKLVLGAYGADCIYCGATGEPTLDHLIPLAAGGAHTIENAVPCCGKCNSAKRDRDVDTFLARSSLDRGSFLIKRLTGLAKLVC